MKTFEQITSWEFCSKGKLIRTLTKDQIKIICDSKDFIFDWRIGDMWCGHYPHLRMGELCPEYHEARLVMQYTYPSVCVQVYHDNIWSGKLGTSPKYDQIVAAFAKFLDKK